MGKIPGLKIVEPQGAMYVMVRTAAPPHRSLLGEEAERRVFPLSPPLYSCISHALMLRVYVMVLVWVWTQVRIDIEKFADIPDDRVFFERLANEEGVMVLPGSCFGAPSTLQYPIGRVNRIGHLSIQRAERWVACSPRCATPVSALRMCVISNPLTLCLPLCVCLLLVFFRLVITSPLDKLSVAYERLAEFCQRHLLPQYRA